MLTESVTSSGGRRAPDVSIITDDLDLAERLRAALARKHIDVRVGATAEEALRLSMSEPAGACIIDAAALRILPSVMRESMRMAGLRDEVLLVCDATREGSSDTDSGSRFVNPRHAIDGLVRQVEDCLRHREETRAAVEQILGESSAIRVVREQIRSVTRHSDVPVLVLGETGTGKELVARALHDGTYGAEARPFVAINCAAIPESLFERELFGHEAGAYTGARGARAGLLESASGGTVFLDDVGKMPAAMQPKLLRVLESREFHRVGSNRGLPLRARIVSAANRNPWLASPSTLRPDLLYRLAGFTLRLPPLRTRTGDIEVLARRFVAAFGERYDRSTLRLTRDAIDLLGAHHWPGNVRELRVCIEHACILSRRRPITPAEVRAALAACRASECEEGVVHARDVDPLRTVRGRGLHTLEKELILSALEAHGGSVSRTAEHLGISRQTLRAKLGRIRND
jgi:two-component system, NtrC family, response regulator AtoC